MEPITREEYYLAKIAGTWQGKTPEPVTIEEYYLATMAGDYSGNTPQPVTRLQYYMAKVAGVWGGAPSPSPSYPQEIENAGQSGEIGVDVYGGNLFDKSTAIFGGVVDKDNGNIAYNERYACSDYIAIPRGISFLYQTGGALNQRAFYDAGKIYISAAENTNKINIPTNARYIRITSAIDKQDMSDIMLNIGSTALPYEPYKPAHKLIVPTSGGLPGIPVSSGGNYTDEKGQQWVADEIDLANGEMVQRIGKTVVDGEKVKFVASSNSVYWNLPFKTSPGIISGSPCTSRYFADGKFWANNSYDFVWTTPGKMKPYFDTSEELNAFCVQKNSEGNPLTIYYCIETPIRTPLSPETIAAYKALRTNSPTTTVINDAGAGMSVGYAKMK